jgi:hypothetical protein
MADYKITVKDVFWLFFVALLSVAMIYLNYRLKT